VPLASAMIALNPTPGLLVIALGISMFFSTFSLPLAPGALQEIMPNAMRGQATAVYVGLTNLVGGGPGGHRRRRSDRFRISGQGETSCFIRLVGGIAGLLAALILTATLRAFRTTVREHQTIEHPSEASPEYG